MKASDDLVRYVRYRLVRWPLVDDVKRPTVLLVCVQDAATVPEWLAFQAPGWRPHILSITIGVFDVFDVPNDVVP